MHSLTCYRDLCTALDSAEVAAFLRRSHGCLWLGYNSNGGRTTLHTVDGGSPAPVDRWFIPLFLRILGISGAGFLPSTVGFTYGEMRSAPCCGSWRICDMLRSFLYWLAEIPSTDNLNHVVNIAACVRTLQTHAFWLDGIYPHLGLSEARVPPPWWIIRFPTEILSS